jgi:DivIVA domain-containing protein
MPLTPEDVRSKRFTPVRFREGYDMSEVDRFLDEVEAELERLTSENDDLRTKLEVAPASSGSDAGGADSRPAPVEAPSAAPDETPAPASERPAKAAEGPPPTVAAASSAAARLLEIAARNADELVDEARNQADQIVGEARSKAERVESDAHTRSEKLEHETAERRTQLLEDLERQREELEREVDQLRVFEREYRARLKEYFETQLAALDGQEDDGRVRSLLGDEG